MPHLSPVLASVCLAASLSACGLLPVAPSAPAPVPEAISPLTALGEGVSAETLDTASAEETAAALDSAPQSGERALGTVTVALGSPTEQGFWIKSRLVSVPAKGRVETADGKSVAVDLLPFDGAALLSFAAFRALELPLTDLPDVTVYAD